MWQAPPKASLELFSTTLAQTRRSHVDQIAHGRASQYA